MFQRLKRATLLTFLTLPLLLTSCSKDSKDGTATPPSPQESPNAPSETRDTRTLKVQALNGTALAGAKVLIGWAQNNPFSGNFLSTDSTGTVVVPEAWADALPVTIEAPGYTRATFLSQLPAGQTLILRAQEGSGTFELNGVTQGFNVVNKDGQVDVGVVIPALRKQDLFTFSVDMVLSSLTDTLKVVGQEFDIPANITIPKQKETYIVPITLEKPNYRIQFRSSGVKSVFTARAQFPLKKVVDGLRNDQSFVDLLNEIRIQGGSLKDVEIKNARTSQNLPVNELNFSQKKSFQTPTFDSSQVLTALALSSAQGRLYPTDVKTFGARQTATLTTDVGAPLLLAVLKNKTEFQSGSGSDRLSAVFMPMQGQVEPQFLALMRDPQLLSAGVIRADVPSANAEIVSNGSYLSLSKVEKIPAGSFEVERLTRLWEVYDPEWTADTKLPTWPGETPVSGAKRWSVLRLGQSASNGSKNVDLGPLVFEHSTHGTHSSVDF